MISRFESDRINMEIQNNNIVEICQDIFESLFKNGQVTDEAIGICLQSIKNGSTESEYFHLFGDPALKVPMVYKNFSNATVTPDTLKTLSTGDITINQNFIFGDLTNQVLKNMV